MLIVEISSSAVKFFSHTHALLHAAGIYKLLIYVF
jgi:hypothetical protein